MSDFNGGPNPFLWAVGGLEKLKPDIKRNPEAHKELHKQYKVAKKNYKNAMQMHQVHQPQLGEEQDSFSIVPKEKPMDKPMSTHPITGESVPTVPVKRSKNNPTPPGTKPKKK